MASLRTAPVVLAFILMFFTISEAREYLVGGEENSWIIPTSPSSISLNRWAEKNQFEVGDTLIMQYDPKTESVLEVKKEDYESCKKSNPIKEYGDGKSKVELEKAGAYYFISGADGHCEKGHKLVVVVLAKHKPKAESPSPSPSPSPSSSSSSSTGSTVAAPSPNGGVLGLSSEFLGIVMGAVNLVVMLFI